MKRPPAEHLSLSTFWTCGPWRRIIMGSIFVGLSLIIIVGAVRSAHWLAVALSLLMLAYSVAAVRSGVREIRFRRTGEPQ
jgi:hypothetical protein